MRVTKRILATHMVVDPDNVTAIGLFKKYGEEKYPGISKASVLFIEAGEQMNMNGMNSNVISIDVGGGKFDHHHQNIDKCATTLVAEELGLDKKPEFQRILNYVEATDLKGIRRPLDFTDFIRCLGQKSLKDEEVLRIGLVILDAKLTLDKKVPKRDVATTASIIETWLQKEKRGRLPTQQIERYLRYIKNGGKSNFDLVEIVQGLSLNKKGKQEIKKLVFGLLDAKYESQKEFFTGATRDLARAEICTIIWKEKKLKIVSGYSDCQGFNSLARNPTYGQGAAIIIQRNNKGNTFIFSNKRYDLAREMKRIAAMIRLAEQIFGKKKPLIDEWKVLSQAKAVSQVKNWYFQKEERGGKLLNGSLKIQADPTKIPLSVITGIVKVALGIERFSWEYWAVKQISRDKQIQLRRRKKAKISK